VKLCVFPKARYLLKTGADLNTCPYLHAVSPHPCCPERNYTFSSLHMQALCSRVFFSFFSFFFLLVAIFLIYIFNAIPKVPHTHTPIPYPPTPPFWPWRSPVLGHIKFASPMGLSLQWWPNRASFDTYAAKDKSSRVLVSSYCCSTYRVAVPFSSLGNLNTTLDMTYKLDPSGTIEHLPYLCVSGIVLKK
jgi:hypothetical protein